MRLASILILLTAAAIAAKLPLDSRDAHLRADGVLFPRFEAALNEFALDHGGPNDAGHLDKLNKKDLENIRAVRETFTAWNDAMKLAGY